MKTPLETLIERLEAEIKPIDWSNGRNSFLVARDVSNTAFEIAIAHAEKLLKTSCQHSSSS